MKSYQEYDYMAKLFNMADSIIVEINDKDYEGIVEELKIGEYVIFSVKNIDNKLLTTPNGYAGVQFKINKKGEPQKRFPTVLLNKKVPRLLLKFPEKEAPKIERNHMRVHVNVRAPLFHVKSKNTLLPPDKYGLGTLTNISEGGCSITINMPLEKGDKIDFFMSVFPEGEEKLLELSGIVRNVKQVMPEVVEVGVQFANLDSDTEKEIVDFLNRKKIRDESRVPRKR